GRELYRRQWQIFSWFAAMPREIIHITPIPDAEIGCFHIGDLIHVEATSEVRGGFSGSQRVYEYTVSWEGSPSVLTLGEIKTTADAEGGAGGRNRSGSRTPSARSGGRPTPSASLRDGRRSSPGSSRSCSARPSDPRSAGPRRSIPRRTASTTSR